MASARINNPQSWNRYSYCANNPVNFIDPNGLDYSDLTDKQKVLINDWAQTRNEMAGTALCPETMYNGLKTSEKATCEAILNALENITIQCKDGRKYQAIDAVQSIDSIEGAKPGADGAEQFRLHVNMKDGASEDILKAKNFSNAYTHEGFAKSRQQKGGAPSVQFCLSKSGNVGQIDIDYESKGFPWVQALVNGHLTPSNSDPRAGNHYIDHESRFEGPAKLGKNYDPNAD